MYQPEQPEEEPDFPGPLMSTEMKKEDLFWFIQWKTKKCSENIAKCNQVEGYFFWQIMELFCHRNGKALMCEVSRILFRGFKLFKRKASERTKWKDWCLPLAKLLCSSRSDEENREAVIEMGNHLASRNLTYGAHICYVVAKVDLGSRSQFELIGCDRVPFGMAAMAEAIKRTETYEYVLSLTTGLAQPSFQIFKLCQANRLALIQLPQLNFSHVALKYCETIARAVIAFPDRIQRSFIERLLLMFSQLQEEDIEEPEWLLELRQLHRTQSADANANGDPEQHTASASHDVVSEIQDSECVMTGEIPDLQFPGEEQHADLSTAFYSRFALRGLLGNGSFGTVYAGLRKEDNKQVAIKFVEKDEYKTMTIPGETQELPVEVAVMKMVSKPPCCSYVVELLDWLDMANQYALVLERPSSCMDVWDFVQLQEGHRLSEAQSRDIMLQVVQVARHCCDRGVLPRDIKAEGLLINPDTMQVKLIDFSSSVLLKDTLYHDISGIEIFMLPEWLMNEEYMGIPATVWCLGVLLFFLLHGDYPFISEEDLCNGQLKFCPDISRECFQLMMWCLELNPKMRPTFDDVLRHEWFSEAIQDKVQIPPETKDLATP